MTTLPAAASFTGASITEGQFKQAMTDMIAYLTERLGSPNVVPRSSNTALDAANVGDLIVATSAFTQTLVAAATLGDWWCRYRNNSAGVITIDPNSGELIDGAATFKLYPGESIIIVCDGSAFTTVASTGAKVKAGSFTRDVSLASGNQAVTGVGFKPKAVIFFADIPSVTGAASWGMDDDTNAGLIRATTTAGQFASHPTDSIFLVVSTDTYEGTINSLDDDGFTIAWTKTGAPTGTATIKYLAIR